MAEPLTFAARIRAVARKVSDIEAAIKSLQPIMFKSPRESRRLAVIGLRHELHKARNEARTEPRQRAKNANTTTTAPKVSAKTAAAVSAVYSKSIFDSYAVGDKWLGDCRVGDLQAAIADHRSQQRGIQSSIKFLSHIVKAMGDTKKQVRRAVKESRVEQWHDEMLED